MAAQKREAERCDKQLRFNPKDFAINSFNISGVFLNLKAYLFLAGIALSLQGCASFSKSSQPEPIKIDRPIWLELSGSLNREELIRYYFASQKKSEGPKAENKDEKVDFKVKTTTTEVFPNGEVGYLIQTVEKKGDIPLHDLAFPEPGERLDQVLTRSSRVLKAGEHSAQSVFFLPPIPLPFVIFSCMKSHIEVPSAYRWKWDSKIECDPSFRGDFNVPGL